MLVAARVSARIGQINYGGMIGYLHGYIGKITYSAVLHRHILFALLGSL
jgi:hypothetical protein